jgi:hypothetical protein
MNVAEVTIDWYQDHDQWVGGCDVLPNVLLLIMPIQWGKCVLRVFNKGNQVHEKEHSDVDGAKDAAVTVLRLISIREAG